MGYNANKMGALERFSLQLTREAVRRGQDIFFIYIYPPLDKLKEKIEDAGGTVHVISIQNRLDLKFIRRLRKFIRENGIQVVDSHFDMVNLTGTFAAFLAGAPCRIWHQRNYVSQRLRFPKYVIYQFFNIIAHGVICTSSMLATDMAKKGIRKELLHAIPPGIDLFLYEKSYPRGIRKELDIPEHVPVVAMISQARPEKGCIHLVKASEMILAHNPEVFFIQVGGGSPDILQSLKEQVSKSKIAENWRWLGPRSDVPGILYETSILVLPSYMESLGNVLIEAQASEVPVVASNVGGVPIAVKDGKTGILVPPGDEDAIADSVIRLLDDPELRRKMGSAGRKHVREKFSVNLKVKETIDLYEKLMRDGDEV